METQELRIYFQTISKQLETMIEQQETLINIFAEEQEENKEEYEELEELPTKKQKIRQKEE